MFLVIAQSPMDGAEDLRANEIVKAMGREPDRIGFGSETGRNKHADWIWIVPTLIDAQSCMACIDMIEDAMIEVNIREQ